MSWSHNTTVLGTTSTPASNTSSFGTQNSSTPSISSPAFGTQAGSSSIFSSFSATPASSTQAGRGIVSSSSVNSASAPKNLFGLSSEQKQASKTVVPGPPHEVVFDPNGDLRLEVGPQKHRFLVCSRTLSRTSRVFQKMLFGPFMESKGSTETSVGKKDWSVQLPDDDVDALMVILHIVHSNFSLVPMTPTLNQLFEITVLTDKYDMTSVLRPWANPWSCYLKNALVKRDTMAPHRGFILWISWELGLVNLYKKTVREIVNVCTIEPKDPDSLIWGCPTPKEREYASSLGIIDQVKEFHKKQVEQFMAIIDTHLQLVQNSCVLGKKLPDCACSPFNPSLNVPPAGSLAGYLTGFRQDHCEKVCPIYAYGALMTCLGKIGVYPTTAGLSSFNRYHCHPSLLSMQRMAAQIDLDLIYSPSKVEPSPSLQSGVLHQCRCQMCDPTVKLKEALEALLRNVPDFVTEQQMQRMKLQQEKTGLTGF